ncbi:unnamed protein product [Closterium sp. Naga37s-1]|nr:unnamed protein product [Closterium sp. Naga37s-1]
MRVASRHGSRYFVTFTDLGTRHTWVTELKDKAEVFPSFVTWMAEAERQSGKVLKVLRTDNGGEFTGKVTITRDVVFYEEVNYLQWKGVDKEIAAAGTATTPDKVEDLLEEKESEGVGDEGDEELEDVERADSVDWVWEKAPTSEADEINGVEIEGEQPSNEVAEGGIDEVAGEEGDEESAAEGYHDPWKLLNSDDSNAKMKEIKDLLEEGAIVIGWEVKDGEGKALADSSED